MTTLTINNLRRAARDLRAGRIRLPERPAPAVRREGKLSLFPKQAVHA